MRLSRRNKVRARATTFADDWQKAVLTCRELSPIISLVREQTHVSE